MSDFDNQQEDYSIVLHFEEASNATPWKIGSYEEKGILSDEEKNFLMEQFKISQELVTELSMYIGNCLDSESELNLERVTRSTALRRGATGLDRIRQRLQRISRDCFDFENTILRFGAQFSEAKEAAHLHDAIKNELARLKASIHVLSVKVADLGHIPDGVAEITPDDKRKSTDMRRQHVIRSCCYIWVDAGRQVTYTTKSHAASGQQRSGPLIDFIQTVIGFVTAPSCKIPVETIRRDIDVFKKMQELPDPMDTPPIRG